jgi:hypothetical protein
MPRIWIDWSLDGDDMSQGTTARVVNMPFGSSVAPENAAYAFRANVHMFFLTRQKRCHFH